MVGGAGGAGGAGAHGSGTDVIQVHCIRYKILKKSSCLTIVIGMTTSRPSF